MIEENPEQLKLKTELLEQQVAALRGSSQELGALMALGMPEKQAIMLSIMVKRYPAVITRETFHSLIYGERADGGPEPAIFGVWISRIRRVLRREKCPGQIEAVWGTGYRVDDETVRWVKNLYKNYVGDNT
jgi:DNA-binding winged helix-turn-helix (wHTH) protein